jgi:hypothetical protein
MLLAGFFSSAGRPLAFAKSASRLNATLSREAASGAQAVRRRRKSACCACVRKSTSNQAPFSRRANVSMIGWALLPISCGKFWAADARVSEASTTISTALILGFEPAAICTAAVACLIWKSTRR